MDARTQETSDVSEFADELVRDGIAVSDQQSGWLATILLDPELSVAAKLALVVMAKSNGPLFDPDDIATKDISDACESIDHVFKAIALFLVEPVGSA